MRNKKAIVGRIHSKIHLQFDLHIHVSHTFLYTFFFLIFTNCVFIHIRWHLFSITYCLAFFLQPYCMCVCFFSVVVIKKSPSITMCNGVHDRTCAMKAKYYNLDYILKTKRYAVTSGNLNKIIRRLTQKTKWGGNNKRYYIKRNDFK